MTNFISAVFGFIGYGVLDVLIFCASVAACAVLLGALFVSINDMVLKGKDYNQEGTAAMMVGLFFGAILSSMLTTYLLCATSAGSTFMTMLGICGCLVVLIVAVLFTSKKLTDRRARASYSKDDPDRFRAF